MAGAVGDRDNFSGDLSLTAPTGGVTRGLIYAIEDMHVVARETADAAASFNAAVIGPIWATKVTGTGKSFAAGDKVFFVSASKSATPSTTGNTLIGFALEAATASATKVLVYLQNMRPTQS